MGDKANQSTGGILFGALIIGLLTPHVFGWFGYGFILLCYKIRGLSSHRDRPSRTSTFLAGMQPKNFELIMLGTSLAAGICVMVGLLKDNEKKKEGKQAEPAARVDETYSAASPTADIDVEAQNEDRSKPPPYDASQILSSIDAPIVTEDRDDMVVNFSGWRVVIKKK